jgi:hypothetical protein
LSLAFLAVHRWASILFLNYVIDLKSARPYGFPSGATKVRLFSIVLLDHCEKPRVRVEKDGTLLWALEGRGGVDVV